MATSTNGRKDASNMESSINVQSKRGNINEPRKSDRESKGQNEVVIAKETDHKRINTKDSTGKRKTDIESECSEVSEYSDDVDAKGHGDPKFLAPRKKRKTRGGGTLDEDSEKEGRPTNENQPSLVFNGMIEFPLEPLKSHLICFSCKGYFREPYTVAECLHTFCKSCLFLKFHSGVRSCPRCDISLDPDPYKAVLSDRTLQELLDKIFPELKEVDEEKELEFYKKRGIELKDNIAVDEDTAKSTTWRTRGSKQSQLTQSNIVKRKDHVSATGRPYGDGYQQSSACRGVWDDKLTSIPVDEINFKLIPDKGVNNPMNSLQKAIVRTSGQLKIAQVKKYLIEKLQLSAGSPNVDVLCNGDSLGDELSLTFIQRTRWLHPSQDLCLHYRLREDGAY